MAQAATCGAGLQGSKSSDIYYNQLLTCVVEMSYLQSIVYKLSISFEYVCNLISPLAIVSRASCSLNGCHICQ